MTTLREITDRLLLDEVTIRDGGGEDGQQRQRRHGRLPVRERLALLLDEGRPFLELGLWAAHGMYAEWGDVPAGGIVTGIGFVEGRACVIAAHDATVKAGAMFPQSIKKLLRAQRIAMQFRLPAIYLVDSAGVFLPLQEDVFPDEDDFGRIFRNNAVMSAMHSAISGTVDFHEPDDETCLKRLRSLVDLLPADLLPADRLPVRATQASNSTDFNESAPSVPSDQQDRVYELVTADGRGEYNVRDVLACIVDAGSLQEYKAEFGQTIVTTFARIGGHPVGIVANQKQSCKTASGELQIGGVLYPEAADKAARFVMDCNQTRVPIVFLQDVQGFMVGKQAEQSGIIRAGAKLVNVVSNSIVPKFTVILGGSFGAGHYAMCGKAYDPTLILAWPSAKYAVMGAGQAAETLLALQLRDAERAGRTLAEEEIDQLRESINQRYTAQTDIRYGAARGWVDAIIPPHDTRLWLQTALDILPPLTDSEFRTGVLQV
jgi:acetyl-CoA carboxylase carboxyltransferase component